MNRKFFERPNVNILIFALLSFVEALQVLILVALICSFIPVPMSTFAQKLFPLSLYDVRLGRESFFYHVWIVAALGLQGILIFANRRRMEESLWRGIFPYICTMALIVYVQIFAVFKIFLWNDPWWARALFYVCLGAGILIRIFWPEFRRLSASFWRRTIDRTIPRWGYALLDAGAIATLLGLIFTPDLSRVLARMFSYDKFYHLDSFIMSPGWAHHNGLILNRDVTSEYSLMVPIVFDGLMKLAGGFSYPHAVSWMIGLSALYYFLLYGLWRYWLGSVALAFFAVILSVKLQFFHWGVVPLIWIYPSATPLRFLPDVFFLFFMLRFTQKLSRYWLCAAALVSGLALAWTIDVGAYMYVTLLAAALALIYQKGIRSLTWGIVIGLLPWAVAGGVLSIFYGSLVWQSSFWHNSFEFASFFMQGWGALPITEGLKDKQFFALCMGLLIPVAYTGTLLYSLGMFLLRRSSRHLWMTLICVYGLGLYHYYVHRSAVTSYDAVAVPLIFVLMFWIKTLLGFCREPWVKALKICLCVWAMTALTTCYLFTYYPNMLNLSGYDWAPEKKFYTEQFDFSQDAALIDRLSAPQEAIPLISSFETKILMQADRKPFFYYFPMMESEHMQGDKLRNFYLHTYTSLQSTIKQLEDKKPAHVFIQTRLFEGPQVQSYEDSHGGFKELMAYIRQHYQYEARGQYLTALKLK